jgi:hypothetical protein
VYGAPNYGAPKENKIVIGAGDVYSAYSLIDSAVHHNHQWWLYAVTSGGPF